MIGYKGFDKDFKCRDFQYEVGKEYVHDGEVKLCESGFHFCENPQGVFGHYVPGNGNRFAIVEADGVSDERESDSKRVANECKVADWACALVDGETIKEDTWYVLKDGKLVEEEK